MDNPIQVSVVCAAYNHGKYIRDALEGFVMQKTDFPFEVIVHDDASTDDTADIIREYEAKYPDIIKPIYQTENQYSKGLGIGLFFIPRVRGRYVAICEGDDYWTDPQKLQKQYDFLQAHPDYSLCACSVDWLNMQTGQVISYRCKTDVDRDISAEELILEKKGRIFQTASVMVLAELFCNRPDWMRLFPVVDAPLSLYAVAQGKIHMMADTMAVYRNLAPGSWTAKVKKDDKAFHRVFEQFIVGMEAFNEATDGRFDDVVKQRIRVFQYKQAKNKRDLRAMISGALREVYLSRSVRQRLSDCVYCLSPKLHGRILRWLGRV